MKHLMHHVELLFFYNWLLANILRVLGQVLGHLKDLHMDVSSGQHGVIAAPFGSHRQLHMVKLLSWPGGIKPYESTHHRMQWNAAKIWEEEENRYAILWGRMEGWLSRRTSGRKDRKKEVWQEKKESSLNSRKAMCWSWAWSLFTNMQEYFWKKEIPGEAMLAPLSSPAFVD